jgi:hypothetical protein
MIMDILILVFCVISPILAVIVGMKLREFVDKKLKKSTFL